MSGTASLPMIGYLTKRSAPHVLERCVSQAVGQLGLENAMRTQGAPQRAHDTVFR
jgi:hypothetical protein